MPRRVSLVSLILGVAIWGVVLLSPQLRLILRSQITATHNIVDAQRQNKDSLELLARKYPDDPRVLVANLEHIGDGMMTSGFQKARLRHYDRLIEIFPREEWLIQNRLRLSTVGGFAIDVGDFVPRKSRYHGQPWLSHSELLQALKIAECGVELNPQNSFYDWMRAIFLFALKRPESALTALQQGARKPHYDDGVLRDMRLKIEVQALQRPLLLEECYTIMAATLLPHYAPLNSANRAAVWRGALAERRGDHKHALEIYGNQMGLTAVMRRDSTLMISQLVAESLSRVTWGSLKRRIAAEEKPEPTQAEILQQTQTLSRTFADYARQHGRPDLAELALTQASKSDGMDLNQWFKSNKSPWIRVEGIYLWKWYGSICLRAFFWCCIGWLIVTGVQQIGRSRNIKEHDIETVSGFDSIATMIFVVIAFATVLFAAWKMIDLQNLQLWILYGDLDPQTSANVEVQGQALIQTFDRWLPFIPLALAVFYHFIAVLWRGRKTKSSPETSTQVGCAISTFVFLLTMIVTVLFTVQQFRFAQKMALNAWAIESWFPLFAPVLMGLFLAFYLGMRFRRAWFFGIDHTLRSLNHNQLLPQSLFLLIVALSGAYLLTSVVALPARYEGNVRLDDLLARGEVAVLRDPAAKSER